MGDIDIEVAPSVRNGFPDPEKTHIVEEQEEKNLSRSLKQRHIQMIALAGAIVRFPSLCQSRPGSSTYPKTGILGRARVYIAQGGLAD